MSGNNLSSSLLKTRKAALTSVALLGLFLSSAPALAQSAPGLSGVEEIVVQNARLLKPEASARCGILSQNITKDFAKFSKEYGAPTVSLLEAKPAKIGAARVDVVAEITTLLTQTGECISYVGAFAQSKNTLIIPPIQVPRHVVVTYWKNGLLVTSTEPAHARLVQDVIDKLARSFAEQYKMDQPPDLSALTDDNAQEEEEESKAK